MQLVLSKSVTTTNDKMPEDLESAWEAFKYAHPSLQVPPRTTLRSSDVLTEACVTLATSCTLSKKDSMAVASMYAFERLGRGSPCWSDSVEVTLPLVAITDSICDGLEAIPPKPATPQAISASPCYFLPALKHILNYEYVILERTEEPQRLSTTFFEALDFSRLRINSWEEFTKNPNCKFACKILTDGFAINLLFVRKAKDKLSSTELDLDDSSFNEVQTHFEPWSLDPGLSQVFAGVNGSGQTPHQVRRISSKEYYAMTGSTRRAKKLQKEKDRSGITPVETDLETCKTASSQQRNQYVACFLRHFPKLSAFYGPRMGESRFQNYQGMQRTQEELTSAEQEVACFTIHNDTKNTINSVWISYVREEQFKGDAREKTRS
ncbi:hypothetical protein DFQ29_001721, partial [Apophysomyces sp. BC1021]